MGEAASAARAEPHARILNIMRNILKKNNIGKTPVLPDIKTYYKAAATKMVWYSYSDRQNVNNTVSRNRPIYVYKFNIK